MTRVGWVILLLILGAAGLFASVLSFGPGRMTGARVATRVPDATRADGLPSLLVPVADVPRRAIIDSWGDPRGGGLRAHHGTDIMAPGGAPVLAAADGTIEKLFGSVLGGITIYERAGDRRWTFYYAHLSGYAPGLREGQPVKAGDVIAYVGDTGDAGAGNFHLHFGLTRTTPDQHWYQGEDVDAYPVLAPRAR